MAAELDGQGNVVSTFVYGTRANVADAMVRGGHTYRLVSDWRGSVRAVVDSAAGTVVESIDYDAWGNATVSDTTCATGAVCALFQPFGFAGGFFDRETGLVRFGARDYDPSVGRWTQKDASSLAAGSNVYVYAGGDPVDFIDLNGHWSLPCGATIGAGLAGGVVNAAYNFASQAFGAAAGAFCGAGGGDIDWGSVATAGALGALGGALGEAGACFEAGTLVATCEDGEQPIETLAEADAVLSRNPDTGELECRKVSQTFVHDADDVVRLSVADENGGTQEFRVTLGHPFWVEGRGWTPVRELKNGDALSTWSDGHRLTIDGWTRLSASVSVFNLEVEGDHSYFVGPDRVWVHNGCGDNQLWYHYTSSPESSFADGLWANSSVTNVGDLTATEASQTLGIPPPTSVIPISAPTSYFGPVSVVSESPRYSGGGLQWFANQGVPSQNLGPALPVAK